MPQQRPPENHATRAVDAIRRNRLNARDDWPDLSERLVRFLEDMYPPKCWDPLREPEPFHHRYAGKVELVETMRAVLGRYADFSEEAIVAAAGRDGEDEED